MKAITISGGESQATVSLVNIPKPELTSPEDVLIQVLCVGLDGTDREIIVDNYAKYPEGKFEMVIGHELLGVVTRAGSKSGLTCGDLVTSLVRRPCGEEDCVNCRNGQQDFCQTGRYVERGINRADGYLCEYVVENAKYVVKVPDECLPYGVLIEPQSIVEKVYTQTLQIQQRMIWQPRTVLVTGSGPLGILAAMTCRVLGLDTYVWSKSDAVSMNAAIIRSVGAIYQEAVSSEQETFLSGITAYAKQLGKKFDMIWECSGYAPLGFEAIPLLNHNGILALLGVTPGSGRLDLPSDLTYQEMVMKNKCIIGSVNASYDDFTTAIDRLRAIESHYPGMLGLLQTNRLDIEDVPAIDFGKMTIKAVVDVVPQAQWTSITMKIKEEIER
ncbi:glucose 1-dehydrogenase [Paenibacillus sacheonensis]|uniref:Alcohol dehydrogenase catalytic domain-containing protein n=1 Tax=Paenibacillus sacheonensis TaxID=742054 RepID=A0A7X4YUM4_9BACL|nr:glucose 1-dehydrogenase [Paenibacillus sacheonensis]MBM7569057.1 threonine dehydrogenase-like Zn-dependent dehydrogenase [Paenibacillus sacheonensis]NBC72763.1 alcohol dehydrogenase catalytic domain-containing protein [Paenibacillus sacheonensis]